MRRIATIFMLSSAKVFAHLNSPPALIGGVPQRGWVVLFPQILLHFLVIVSALLPLGCSEGINPARFGSETNDFYSQVVNFADKYSYDIGKYGGVGSGDYIYIKGLIQDRYLLEVTFRVAMNQHEIDKLNDAVIYFSEIRLMEDGNTALKNIKIIEQDTFLSLNNRQDLVDEVGIQIQDSEPVAGANEYLNF